MTAITITAETIAKLEAKGFNRWTKGNMDRLYIDAKNYGAEFVYYNSGNIRSAKFQGERISNADGRRLNATKAYIDLATGELHIQTDYYYDDEIRDAIEAIIAEVKSEIEAEEAATRAEAEHEEKANQDTTTKKETAMSNTEYVFTSANKGDVHICVTGDYYDGCKDVEVSFGDCSDLHEERFNETDDASEIMGWLVANGVRFESKRSALFNHSYIQSVMIDRDATEASIVAYIAALSDGEVESQYATWIDDADQGATTFATMDEATEYVETALGEHAGDFDAETIAREVTDWQDGKLTLTAEGDEFWAVAERHDLDIEEV